MTPRFVHLRLHSEYSLVDGLVRLKPLVKMCAEQQMPAVALTDNCNFFGLIKFYRAAMGAGVKPICGVDILLENEQDQDHPFRMTLLAMTADGYRNITRLISRAYIEGQQTGLPLIKYQWLDDENEDVIVLSGAREGDIGQALLSGKPELAASLLAHWQKLYPDRFYIELQRTGRPNEDEYLFAAVDLATQHNVPVVATNDVRFLKADDFNAHEVRVCVHDGVTQDDPRREKNYSQQQYLRSEAEMCELFSDIPEALENSVEIAKRCNIEIGLGTYYLPNYPIPEGMTIDEFFCKVSWDGLEERLDFLFDRNAENFAEIRKPYDERLQIELDVICQMGFPGYFLIVMDFIQWAKDNGVPVGPGRGSGAGSLVAYAQKITDLDPLEYDLLFERFLNPERVSMPDFDIDFCMEGRDRVIEYVANTYGRESVSQIATFGTMAAKGVIRDVGRVLGHPYGFVDRITKLIPFDLGMTLTKALEMEPVLKDLYDNDEEVTALLDMGLSLEGITRQTGKHAGGVVISPSLLTDFTPLLSDGEGGGLVTQLDKDDVESVGLVKFDFLGLRTLTIIDWALEIINAKKKQTGEDLIDIARIPLEDPKSFRVLKDCCTTAVFQLESRGMKDLIKRLQPDCFEDIIALVALFRPGPLGSGMVDDFINRKHGKAVVAYPHADYQHPDLKPVLEPTYGIILYQEQVMQIAQVLAKFSLGGADLLRRAMGKKKVEVMQEQRLLFQDGAETNNVSRELSGPIFDLMEKFAGYGFNKSHSAAYALVSYQTLWLKTHYPAAFMAAVCSSDMDNTEKVVILIEDCRDMKLTVTPPDVNSSAYKFTVNEQDQVVYGLGAVKGVGEGAIEGIVNERQTNGPFKDLFDFCNRIDLKKANRRVLESLIRAGALDLLAPVEQGLKVFDSRSRLMATLEGAIKAAEQQAKAAALGQNDLFGAVAFGEADAEQPQFVAAPAWRQQQRLHGEKETLGLYLTGHPIDDYLPELKRMRCQRIADLKPARGVSVTIAGLVLAFRTKLTKTGKRMAFVTLDDRSGRIEVAIFGEDYDKNAEKLAVDKVLVIDGEVVHDDFSGGQKMQVKKLHSMAEARSSHARCLRISLKQGELTPASLEQLRSLLEQHTNGQCSVRFDYQGHSAIGSLAASEDWKLNLDDELLHQLEELLGRKRCKIDYSG